MQAKFNSPCDTSTSMDALVEDRFASTFGMSSEQFMRELEAEFEQNTPEERAEFERLVDQANAVMPGIHATLDRIGKTLAGMSVAVDQLKDGMTTLDARVTGIEGSFGCTFAAKPPDGQEKK